jgi:hypothetical protein
VDPADRSKIRYHKGHTNPNTTPDVAAHIVNTQFIGFEHLHVRCSASELLSVQAKLQVIYLHRKAAWDVICSATGSKFPFGFRGQAVSICANN